MTVNWKLDFLKENSELFRPFLSEKLKLEPVLTSLFYRYQAQFETQQKGSFKASPDVSIMLQTRRGGQGLVWRWDKKRLGGNEACGSCLKLTFSSSSLKASSACLTSVPTKWDLSTGSERPYSTIAFSVALMVLRTSVVRSQRAAAVDLWKPCRGTDVSSWKTTSDPAAATGLQPIASISSVQF